MDRLLRQISRTVTVVLLALALGLVGYGHRMQPREPVDLSAYAMPDGTLPQLCLDGSGKGMADPAPCPACLIAAALDLPVAIALPARDLVVSRVVWADTAQTLMLAHPARAPPARGPPAVLI